jgi:hypothetical protein
VKPAHEIDAFSRCKNKRRAASPQRSMCGVSTCRLSVCLNNTCEYIHTYIRVRVTHGTSGERNKIKSEALSADITHILRANSARGEEIGVLTAHLYIIGGAFWHR